MASRFRSPAAGRLALSAAAVGVAAAALRGRLARFEVVEDSMRPALAPGDYVITVAMRVPRRGATVAYPDPLAPDRTLLKRIVALPGETVTIAAGQVAVDGTALAERWADGPTLPEGKWTCPAGTVFLLGDNRSVSAGDSRFTGPVRVDAMFRVVWRYWPISSFGRV